MFACIGDESSNFEVEVKRLDSIYSVDPQTAIYSDYADEYGYFWEIYTQNIIPLSEEAFSDSLQAFQEEKDFAMTGLWYRLSDKINRWKNMILTDRKCQNETLIDTFQDITNYGIICQMVSKDKWK